MTVACAEYLGFPIYFLVSANLPHYSSRTYQFKAGFMAMVAGDVNGVNGRILVRDKFFKADSLWHWILQQRFNCAECFCSFFWGNTFEAFAKTGR